MQWQHKIENMQLRILHSQVLKLDITKIDKKEKKNDKKSFDIGFEAHYDTDDNTVFVILFDLEIYHPNDFKLKCKYGVWFKTSEAIDDAFKTSPFPTVNAPAIAFPFLRSLISTITVNSGYNPAILPSINFTDFKNKK